MLTHLHIENYTLIENLDLDLNKGFSVISGETGAGKSILLGAIGLLTGDRADLSVIQTGKQRCILAATFNIEGTRDNRSEGIVWLHGSFVFLYGI